MSHDSSHSSHLPASVDSLVNSHVPVSGALSSHTCTTGGPSSESSTNNPQLYALHCRHRADVEGLFTLVSKNPKQTAQAGKSAKLTICSEGKNTEGIWYPVQQQNLNPLHEIVTPIKKKKSCSSPRLTAMTRLFSSDYLKQIQILAGNNSSSSCEDEIIVTFLHCGWKRFNLTKLPATKKRSDVPRSHQGSMFERQREECTHSPAWDVRLAGVVGRSPGPSRGQNLGPRFAGPICTEIIP